MFTYKSYKTQSGFSILEVLISVFILSIGLLGLANLQITSLQSNHSAQHRTTATLLAYDMLDRIRLNKTADYSLSMTTTKTTSSASPSDPSSNPGKQANPGQSSDDSTPVTPPDDSTSLEAPLSQKDKDLTAWQTLLAEQLPSGKGGIQINDNVATVTVQWDDSRAIKGSTQQTFQVSTQYD